MYYIIISEADHMYKLRHITDHDMQAVKDGLVTILRISGYNVEEMTRRGDWIQIDWHDDE